MVKQAVDANLDFVADGALPPGIVSDDGVDNDGDTLIDEDPVDGVDNDADTLIARTKDAFDQAVPSGLSMAALLCLRLGELAGGSALQRRKPSPRRVPRPAVCNRRISFTVSVESSSPPPSSS